MMPKMGIVSRKLEEFELRTMENPKYKAPIPVSPELLSSSQGEAQEKTSASQISLAQNN
jgi:hypothetical protein